MDIQQLKYFLAIASTHSFSKAAKTLGITQPSLSQQIQKLELELGQPVFDRLPRGVILTEAGRTLAEQSAELLEKVTEIKQRVADITDTISGELSIGIIPTMGPYLLPDILKVFVEQYPDVDVTIHERTTRELINMLELGEIDVGIMSWPINHEYLHVEKWFNEQMQLCVPSNHKLARKRSVKISDLAGEKFMVLEEMHCMGQQVVAYCNKNANDLRIAFTGSQVQTLQEMVGAGLGLSFIPEMGIKHDAQAGGRRIYRRLSDGLPERDITIVWHLHRYRSNPARAFIETCKQLH